MTHHSIHDCLHHWEHFQDGSLCKNCQLIRLSSGQWKRLLDAKPDVWCSLHTAKSADGKSTLDTLRLIERLHKDPKED